MPMEILSEERSYQNGVRCGGLKREGRGKRGDYDLGSYKVVDVLVSSA